MTRKTKEAFLWIIRLLRKQRIPFQIFGGFAANIYGSKRQLADIDIEIPTKKLCVLLPHVKKYVTYGPKRYKDRNYDLLLLTLRHKGQEIDICGSETIKIFNKKAKKWVKVGTNLSKTQNKKVYGHSVPVMKIKDLINLKQKLGRRVDIKDIRSLSR